ncbi:Uncharacterized membrane protein YkvA, DUF1232 family [Candidatus Thermokryptus mobilis]|uniref:Uncharacterized membrane protein YkvA, DUF1232 family n=1 Tax=Candidatus Thermokryptus mobilis TaxID=1643428 RepID=A0A0S4N8F7_9BACT|nr:YkvA family protein [Candidatus Thermokryptus mobilis]CUU07147.1 Uncharacterized membrane protein YkvA, DUF1232 family [Candidatus Thermokryptus mobilis]
MSENFNEIIGSDASIHINGKISEKEIEYVEKNFWSKLASVKGKVGFKRDLIALYKYMKDPQVPLIKKAIVIFALIYFILPLDSIPDISPIVGFLDDIGIVAMVIKYLSKEIEPYYD